MYRFERWHYTRSLRLLTPLASAQWSQQYITPLASSPWPMIRHWQCSQVGANAWIAHSKLSKTWDVPSLMISKLLSYSLPHVSQVFIFSSLFVFWGWLHSPYAIAVPVSHEGIWNRPMCAICLNFTVQADCLGIVS